MSLRANFKQAINELSGSSSKTVNTLEQEAAVEIQASMQSAMESDSVEVKKVEAQAVSADKHAKHQGKSSQAALNEEPKNNSQNPEAAVITADTQIHGAIVTKSPLIVRGKVKGNILCEETVRLTGEIEGNVTAMSIEIKGAAIKGDLRMKYTAILEELSTLNGNLEADSAVINGNVNGDMRIHGNLKIMQSSKINGDIFAGSLEIAKGAVISGKVSVLSEELNSSKQENTAPVKQNPGETVKIAPKAPIVASAVMSNSVKA